MIEKELKKYLDQYLTDKRRRHTEGVLQTALQLAGRYDEGTGMSMTRLREQIELAAWCHDMFRGRSAAELDALIDRYAPDPRYRHGVDPKYKGNANLAHGKLAAASMERDFHITDQEVLDAVSYHTTGRAGMTLLDKIIYLADAIEPGRDYPGVETLRRMAGLSLDAACLASLQGTAAHLQEQGIPVDEDTLAAIEWLQSYGGQADAKMIQ